MEANERINTVRRKDIYIAFNPIMTVRTFPPSAPLWESLLSFRLLEVSTDIEQKGSPNFEPHHSSPLSTLTDKSFQRVNVRM